MAFQQGVTLLLLGQLHVQLFKAGFGHGAALVQIGQGGFGFRQVGLQLLAAALGLLGLLLQLQGLHLQLLRDRKSVV